MRYLNEITQIAKSLILLTILLVSFPCGTLSQIYPSSNYTTNDGLPSNCIRAIYKDSRGLLWLGTEAGLCSYDGLSFKVYNETNGFKSGSVWSITEDEEGNLWISIYGIGLAKFDGKNFTYYAKESGLINNYIRKLLYSVNYRCLLIGTENGLSVFEKKGFKSFLSKDTSSRFQIVDLQEYENKLIVTSREQGLFELNIGAGVQKATIDSLFAIENTFSSYFHGDKLFTKGDGTKLNVYNIGADFNITSKPTASYTNHIVWNFAGDGKGKLYMATWDVSNPTGGLYVYDNGTVKDINGVYGISTTALWSLYLDTAAQVLWVGSLDNGLYKLDLSGNIKHFDSKYFNAEKLKVLVLHFDSRNHLWAGAENYILKKESDDSWTVMDTKLLWQKLQRYFQRNHISLQSSPVYQTKKYQQGFTPFSFAEDAGGNIWLSTTWGVLAFDSLLEIISAYYSDGSHIAFDANDRLLYSNMYGDFAIADKHNIAGSLHWFSVNNPRVPKDVNRILKSGNEVWYGSYSSGLYRSNDTNFCCVNLTSKFSEKYIADLTVNSKAEVLVASASGKVYTCKLTKNLINPILKYEIGKPLYGSSISFAESVNEVDYIGTNLGINVVRDGSLTSFINAINGLPTTHFQDAEHDTADNIYVATDNGILVINKAIETSNSSCCKADISINSIKVNGEKYKAADTANRWGNIQLENLVLPYNQNDIEIFFAQNNIYTAGQNLYRYKIDGLAEHWTSFEQNGTIQLKGVSSGTYVLHLQSKNISGGGNVAERKLQLTILPPYWATTWFKVMIIGLIGMVTYLFYKLRLNQVKIAERKKAEVAKRIAESKLQALQAQMNPHFTFNAINSIQNFIIDKDNDKALFYLSEFSKLIRNTLEGSSEKFISLQAEVEFIECYLKIQQLRFENVKTIITVAPDINLYSVFVPPLIVQPIIENVFEHAFDASIKKPQIEINYTTEQNLLVCEVKDNGIGFASTEKIGHKSRGLQLVKDRLIFLNEELNTCSFTFGANTNSVEGTTVRLTFPISKSASIN